MTSQEQKAAQMLLGRQLENGWSVIEKYLPKDFRTGGVYSACYKVQRGDSFGFLKAFDYSNAEQVSDLKFPDQLAAILDSFNYEKEILERCSMANCRNVVKLIEIGSIEIIEAPKWQRVDYLILEFAEGGNMHIALEQKNGDLLWKLNSLHQITKGLIQIHNLQIAHQDLKPSNVISSGDGTSKLTDFGSAVNLKVSDRSIPKLIDDRTIAGTWEYAPPELLYYHGQHIEPNQIKRRIGCDLYLLGNMVVFYFTNLTMNTLIRRNLDVRLCWTNNENLGKYIEILPFLSLAFEKALEDFSSEIKEELIKDRLVYIVRQLCNPHINQRGHPKNIGEIGSNHNLSRFLSLFMKMAWDLQHKN